MAKQTINIGAAADDGTGDTLRVAGDKINDNFDELYATSTLTSETLTVNGNASTNTGLTIINKATAITIGMNAGNTVGQSKIMVNSGAGNATIAPNNFITGAAVLLEQGESAHFVWDGSNWFLVASVGGTLQ